MRGSRIVLAALVLLAGALVLLVRQHRPAEVAAAPEPADQTPSSPGTAAEPPTAAPGPPPRPPGAAPVVRRPLSEGPTEASLMAELRELGASDPSRALALAREGNRRFPASPDAAERSWTICKSLAALGRFSEAQQEARRTVEQYPGTSWASDVRRHLLTQPLEDPGQRGYGKASELD